MGGVKDRAMTGQTYLLVKPGDSEDTTWEEADIEPLNLVGTAPCSLPRSGNPRRALEVESPRCLAWGWKRSTTPGAVGIPHIERLDEAQSTVWAVKARGL